MKSTKAAISGMLDTIRKERKPSKRGIMLLTNYLGGAALQGRSLDDEHVNKLELLFWITHDGEGNKLKK